MNKIVLKIHEYLEKAASGKIKPNDKLIDEFGERVKKNLRKVLDVRDNTFKLRMSNIGRPLRQLMLEQKYGKGKPNPDFLLKMLFGDLYESLVLYLLKASGLEVTEEGTEVRTLIKTKKGPVNLDGTLDIGLKVNGEDGIYDVKSASPYSFANKFDVSSLLAGDDSFGYVDQLFGYAAARNKKAKGWIVIDKSSGAIKVVDIPENLHDELIEKSKETIKNKVCHIVEGGEIPECKGAVPEKFYGKTTGNIVLNSSCRFCDHKDKCHPGIQYMPSISSKAKDPKWEWYVKIKEPKDV